MYEIILPRASTTWRAVIAIILMKLGQHLKYPLNISHRPPSTSRFNICISDESLIHNSSKQVTTRMLGLLFYPKYSLTYQIWLNELKKKKKNSIPLLKKEITIYNWGESTYFKLFFD
jgi:hypothetical protein